MLHQSKLSNWLNLLIALQYLKSYALTANIFKIILILR